MSPRAAPASGAPEALTEPVEPVGGGWTAALSLANGALWVGWFGPLQILLALQAAELAPPGTAKESVLAWVTGAGAAVVHHPDPEGGVLILTAVNGALLLATAAAAGLAGALFVHRIKGVAWSGTPASCRFTTRERSGVGGDPAPRSRVHWGRR